MKRYKSIFMAAGLAALALSGCRGSSDSVSDGTVSDAQVMMRLVRARRAPETGQRRRKGSLNWSA